MKKLLAFSMTSVLLLASHSSDAKELVVALSPHQASASAQAQVKAVLQFLTQLDPGDEAIVLDGYHLKSLGRFHVPEKASYASPKARMKANRKVVGALMRFAKNALAPASGAAPVPAAVRLPHLLRHVAENCAPSEKMDVIVLGSPFYDDVKEPQFSMDGGIIPGDGHLNNSRAKTPFGTTDNPQLLSSIRVHLGYGDEAVMPTDQHSYFIERFWTLFIEKQGGVLVTFTSDTEALFRRVQDKAKAPQHSYKLEETTKLEMIRLLRESEPGSIYERPVTKTPVPAHNLHRYHHIEIGLSWDCEKCDLDLYARHGSQGPLIFFGNNNTPDGVHRKDYRHSPRGVQSYETIEFKRPVDIRELKIAVNFYRGRAPHGVKGEVRLAIDDQTYAMPFHLSATSGNRAQGVKAAFEAGTPSDAHTVMIDPLHVLKHR